MQDDTEAAAVEGVIHDESIATIVGNEDQTTALRAELNARLAAAEARGREVDARLETRFVQIEGKLETFSAKFDAFISTVTRALDGSNGLNAKLAEVVSEDRESRRIIVSVTISAAIAIVAIIIAVQFGIVEMFSAA